MGNTDSIPVLSQIKSIVQVISGDAKAAKKTQENFRDTAPVVSQITSVVHAANGDHEAARNVQEKFAKGVESFVDGAPVIGHIKGGVHYALGDKDRGDEIMKGASRSFLTIPAGVGGFVAGGPAGGAAAAIAAGQAYDGIVTGVDTAVNGKVNGSPRYYGSWATYDRIGKGKASTGEVFDTVAGIGFDGLGGATIAKIGGGFKGFVKAVGKELGDEIPGSQIIKRKRKHQTKRNKQNTDTSNTFRCKRDAEYHLTSDESAFVNEHLALDGGVGNIIKADWQHMTVPDTVSNLVTLFVLLKLIVWNDKNGRNYSRELCSYTSHSDNEIDNCQFELLVNLRMLENQMQYDTDQSLYSFITDPNIQSAMGESSRVMIQGVMELFGILSSIGDHRQIGILWAEELCIFERPSMYESCKNELIEKLHNISLKAHQVGQVRKRRSSQCKVNGHDIPKLLNNDMTKIKSKMVGPYRTIMTDRYRKANKIDVKAGNLEANHIPPKTLSLAEGLPANELVAHYLPKAVHQNAMTHVGTSKNSYVARALRSHQQKLIRAGRLDQAIALDIVASYGRANVKMVTSKKPSTFRPAIIEYRNDLHAVINAYVSNDAAKIGKSKISKNQAKALHDLVEKEVKFYENHPDLSVADWFDEVENVYEDILYVNRLTPSVRDKVLSTNQGFGR